MNSQDFRKILEEAQLDFGKTMRRLKPRIINLNKEQERLLYQLLRYVPDELYEKLVPLANKHKVGLPEPEVRADNLKRMAYFNEHKYEHTMNL